MGPGSLAGLVVGTAVCAVFGVVAVKVSKKEAANTNAILAGLTDEQKNEIMNQTYTQTEGKDMFISNAFVTSVTQDGDKVKAVVMFYMQEHQDFYTRNVKLTQAEATAKGIAPLKFVPVLMKYDREMHYYDFKKLV